MIIRDYSPEDASVINRLAPAAYAQYSDHYSDWPAMAASLARMSDIAENGKIFIAETEEGRIVGAVAYVPPHAEKPDYFDRSWAVIRMLLVAPDARGRGVGTTLTDLCLARARQDKAPIVALHTTPMMQAALGIYRAFGFRKLRELPPIFGVPYAVYGLHLDTPQAAAG